MAVVRITGSDRPGADAVAGSNTLNIDQAARTHACMIVTLVALA